MSADRTTGVTTRGEVLRRVWRAPAEHGTAVIDPTWESLPQVVASNIQLWSTVPADSSGMDWTAWRARCRQACLAAAKSYTAQQLGCTVPLSTTGPLIVGGHQPELFHPGVWAKNIAMSRLAARLDGLALNLIVDSDASATFAIAAPAGTATHPRRDTIAFDTPRVMQPWEIAAIQNRDMFTSFGDRVTAAMRAWSMDPVVQSAWPAAIEQSRRTGMLADAFTAARVSQERQWGITNLELPLSRMCSLAPFQEFAASILLRLPEFVRQHNQVLKEYRDRNGVRSRSHPVPELVQQDGWWEAPFWVWRGAATQRERPFVRCANEVLIMRDQAGEFLRVPAEQSALAAALATLESQQIRFRTRALTTTLFARLGLADLFVHGLGGAKYDEMTDALMVRCFDRDPPQFLTVSATFHLPFQESETASLTRRQRGELRHRLRDVGENPQRLVTDPNPDTQRLLQERQQLLEALHGVSSGTPALSCGARRESYLKLREIRRLLLPAVESVRQSLQASIQRGEEAAKHQQIFRNREYSWVLFPRQRLEQVWDRLFS